MLCYSIVLFQHFVRALLGAIFENLGLDTETISSTLNGATSYRLPVSDQVLSNKKNWNIFHISSIKTTETTSTTETK